MGSSPNFITVLRPRLPLLLWMVLGSTLLSFLDYLIPGQLFPVPSSALGWLVPIVAVIWFFLPLERHPAFPIKFWLPWVLWVAYYVLSAEVDHAFQRSVMLLCSLALGLAVSALHPKPAVMVTFRKWMKKAALAFILVAVLAFTLVGGLATRFLEDLQLGGAAGFAAGSMTAVVLACWFATRFASGDRSALWWWSILTLVPLVALTRMAMLAVAVTLPLTLAPFKLRWRLTMLALAAIAGLAVFQTERVQAKMFYSGQGTLEEAARGFLASLQGRGDYESLGAFAQTGRVTTNAILIKGLADEPWLGHGANASEMVAIKFGGVTHPHNDWLRIWYDYGGVGLLLFAGAMIGQARHAVCLARRVGGEAAICLYAGASTFLPMALLMLTDNVILYAAFFGNLQFMMLGLGYAAVNVPRSYRVGQKSMAFPSGPT